MRWELFPIILEINKLSFSQLEFNVWLFVLLLAVLKGVKLERPSCTNEKLKALDSDMAEGGDAGMWHERPAAAHVLCRWHRAEGRLVTWGFPLDRGSPPGAANPPLDLQTGG